MYDALKRKGWLVLVLACALLWANFAWALPWDRVTEEPESSVTEELPIIGYEPLTYGRIAYDEISPRIFDIAAAGENWTCVNCAHANPADAKYCSACGTKKGEEAAATGLSDARVCPKCGFVNEKGARFCGDCAYGFYAAGGRTPELELVYVPGRGYVPKGTMIEPGHARTGMWVTGLLMWLVFGPAIAAHGINEKSKPIYIMAGVIWLTGEILFIVGIGAKTEPVYAFHTAENEYRHTRLAYARKSLDAGEPEIKIELPLISF